MNLEKAALVGEMECRLYGPRGLLKEFRKVKNITVNTGFDTICLMMGKGGHAAFKYCAIGDDSTTPSTLDTALGNELARQEGGFTKINDRQWKNDSTFSPGVGTGSIVESGMLNASSSGTLLCHQTFGAVSKESGDTLVITWQYSLS